jgi:hypothetical protein
MSSKRLSQHALRELGIDEASIRAATPEPSAEAHPFKDEWAAQRKVSGPPTPSNTVAGGKPINAGQPCFTCGVAFADHEPSAEAKP